MLPKNKHKDERAQKRLKCKTLFHWTALLILCFTFSFTFTFTALASEGSDNQPAAAAHSNNGSLGALAGGISGGGIGAAIGSAVGKAGIGAMMGSGLGALGGAFIAAPQILQRNREPSPSEFPRWTVSEEVMVFDRVRTAGWSLVERVPGTVSFSNDSRTAGSLALSSHDLEQGYTPGMRLGATYHLNRRYDLIASFFCIRGWDSSRSIGPDDPLNWLVMRAPGAFFQTQDFSYQSMTWNYLTRLYNTEFNVQRKFSERIKLLAGFRWVQLNENLQGTLSPPDRLQPLWKYTPSKNLYDVQTYENQPGGTPAPAYPPFWDTNTRNNLFGFQVGADGRLFDLRRFSLSGLVKAGAYLNHATESSAVSLQKIIYNSEASTNHAAFVGETSLECKYQMTRRITMKFGYEVLWVAGVALAPGQIEETYTIAPNIERALGINCGSDVLFHGATAGLEFSF